MASSNISLGGQGDGGAAAFGGVAPIYAPDAAQSLALYLFSPIVDDHEVLDWELRATERAAAVVGVADTPATRLLYADAAETSGLRVSLLDPAGAAGNAWAISRGVNNGAIRFEHVEDLQLIRLAGEIFNNATTFAQLLAAANSVDFISAEYFGGAGDATLVISSNILIPPGNHLFLNGVDGTPAVAEEAIGATVDADNEAVLLRIRTTDTAGDIKAVVDAVDGLGSDYQGGILADAVANRALPWTEPFTLVTVVGGPEGPEGMLTAADRQTVNDARDAAQTAATEAAASATDADSSETDAETAQAASEAARDSSGVAQQASESARDQSVVARMAAAASANDADADRIAAGTARAGAEAAQAAAEVARDAAQAQTGFTAALTEAVTGNEETGIDVTVDADGKLNFVVTGGGTPPVTAHSRYLALTTVDISTLDDADRAAAFLDDSHGATSETEDITIPVFAQNLYLTFTRQADLAAPTFIGVKNGQNQIGAFIQLAPTHNVVLGGAEQALWEHVDSNGEAEVVYPVLSGTVWTIR